MKFSQSLHFFQISSQIHFIYKFFQFIPENGFLAVISLDRVKRIKILFIVNRLTRRGAEQQLFNFIKAIPGHFDIHVFKFSYDDREFLEFKNDERVKIYSNRFQGTYNLLKIWPLYRCLYKGKYDVVVTLGLGTALLLGRFCAIMCGKEIIYSILNTYENFNKIPKKSEDYFDILNTKINNLGSWLPMKRIQRFLPNSKKLATKIGPDSSIYLVDTLYNGYSKTEFDSFLTLEPDKDIRQIYNQIREYPIIVQVGAVDENKNQKFTLECLQDISKQMPDVRLLIIGEGERKNEFKNWVLTAGLGKNVIFTGQISRNNCMYLMSKANLLVLTSDSESFPNVLAEGHAISLPIVTFDVGAAAEIVENGNTGYVIPKGNSEQFIQKVIKLLQDESLAKQMGRNGRKRIFDQFSMEQKVQKFVSMLDQDLKAIKNPNKKKS